LADKLKGRICIVTGASKGIGQAIALLFAAEGATVIINYNSDIKAAANTEKKILKSGGPRPMIFQADVSSRRQVQKMVGETIRKFGKIDILVNNAGFAQQKEFEKISDEDWDRAFAVNMKGVFMVSQEVFPYMRKKLGGKMINIASVSGQLGGTKGPHYSAAKAGVICFTKSLAKIGARYNILINAIAPGFIKTKAFNTKTLCNIEKKIIGEIPLKRMGDPQEIAFAALFLASDEADYITGQVINVSGGYYIA